MSSVQGEADNGHAQSSDEKNEQEENNANIDYDNDEIASFGTLEEPREREDEESLTPNGATFDDSGSHIPEVRDGDSEHSRSHRALERPSSADGSLSIPDDTSSVQVHTQWDMFRCYFAHFPRAL